MPKVFFSFASEDERTVDQVYRRVMECFPDIKPWMYKYEIVGGDDLIEKIAAGMDAADKFFDLPVRRLHR